MRPVIITVGEDGNTGRYYRSSLLSLAYSDAVSAAGGLPAVALDNRHPEDCAAVADGLLLSGGQDLACGSYGALRPLQYDYPICLNILLSAAREKEGKYGTQDRLGGI